MVELQAFQAYDEGACEGRSRAPLEQRDATPKHARENPVVNVVVAGAGVAQW